MNTHNAGRGPVSRPKIAMAMIACGIIGAAFIGAASAATSDDDVPSITVRYNPQSLDTESGARALYARLVKAAAEVCAQGSESTRWITKAVLECREQSIARAVFEVNNPKLAAVYATRSKRG